MPNLWSKERRPRGSAPTSTDGEGEHPDYRSPFQHDYDRLLFSTPVRRLADKTQVWPMDENDGVRTRLTHSHEVSNLTRSLTTRICISCPDLFESADLGKVLQPISAAIGLCHDLGNPPFGHQGEKAIGAWFFKRKEWIFTREREGSEGVLSDSTADLFRNDFLCFDGNPQTLRLVTQLQTHRLRKGLDLTAATLAASMKYCVSATNINREHAAKKKAGYFESEREIVEWIRGAVDLKEGERHPLAWIMEACDDIAYSVLDVVDLLKKRIISPDDILAILKHFPSLSDQSINDLEVKFGEINDESRNPDIKRDIKIQYFQAYMFDSLIKHASDEFVGDVQSIISHTRIRSLMGEVVLCSALQFAAREHGFGHSSVLRAEAEGAAAIEELMSAFWDAISARKVPDDFRSLRSNARSKYVFSLVSPNYIEAAEAATPLVGLRYRELRLLTDMISGMTDSFALKVWRDIKAIPYADRP